jgi:dienelactone hydrolase
MSIWTEIRRRKVFQVGVAYAIVGWLLIQVADIVFPSLQLPDWSATLVIVLVVFCFPIALFLAWAYELTPDGIKRTGPSDDEVSAAHSSRFVGYGITALLAATAGAAGFWLLASNGEGDAEWLARTLTQIESRLDEADFEPAYALVREVQQRFPNDTELQGLWSRVSWDTNLDSEPEGAHVYRRAYGTDNDWEDLGTTPLANIRVPHGLSELRLELPGYRTLHRTIGGGHLNWETLGQATPRDADMLMVGPELYRFDTEASLPADMVRVSGWTFATAGDDYALEDFFLGRYEVTNEEYKAFVDDDGYRKPNLWDPIVFDGEELPLARALELGLFNDRTGIVGPYSWSAGDYADGEGEMPVSGVSWYEASAYARWSGRELPTSYHWQQAIAFSTFPWQLPLSNFSRQGPRRVTESRAMSYAGAFDMAGNVREWTANALGDEKVILGGNWNDDHYIAGTRGTAAPPLDRSDGNGIRLMESHDLPQVAAVLREPLPARPTAAGDTARQAVDDATYAAYSLAFDYDRNEAINASIEDTDEQRVWRREKISFNAAYGNERALLYLYLPANAAGPFQTVVYWCGWDTFGLDDVDLYFARQVDFIVKQGRAVAFPVLPGIFERRTTGMPGFNTPAWRENVVNSVKDIRRAIDYLETRRDIDASALAYFGYSWGGVNAPVTLAQEDRFDVAVIDIGLMPAMPSNPNVDPINSLPRIDVPTLMFSGEFDPMVSRADATTYFDLIGVPEDQKRHVWALGGHFIPRDMLISETLDWLDRYLGPTKL